MHGRTLIARPAACFGQQGVRPALPIVGQQAETGRPSRDLRPAIARPLMAHSSAPTSQYRATSALNFVGSSRPASGRRAAIVRDIVRPRACSFARTLGQPHTAAAGGFDFKNFSFSICNFKIRYNYGTIVLKDPSHSSDTTVVEPWRIRIPSPGEAAKEQNQAGKQSQVDWIFTVGGGRLRLIRATTGRETPSSACTRRPDEIGTNGNSSKSRPEQIPAREAATAWWPTAAAASEERREAAEN
ncbi:pentatricopeptide repeat-containing protein [Dorcoceras hygrometricum]|uniref:Pentatricopeptide repeat-containing protein n=1 Tax=Dorcoceras hygrometricum TaxID=472368 RepID=A0A2Z7BQ62_9LAMI|nr:pentatricopeptide repeat-containing protein [Dorcoceras hygrometricum]